LTLASAAPKGLIFLIYFSGLPPVRACSLRPPLLPHAAAATTTSTSRPVQLPLPQSPLTTDTVAADNSWFSHDGDDSMTQ